MATVDVAMCDADCQTLVDQLHWPKGPFLYGIQTSVDDAKNGWLYIVQFVPFLS